MGAMPRRDRGRAHESVVASGIAAADPAGGVTNLLFPWGLLDDDGRAMAARTSFSKSVDLLMELLVGFGPGNDVLANPWVDEVPGFDREGASTQRVHNLRVYLELHRHARWMLVGQEAGYAGCRFSGIPFTSEDMLEGPSVHPLFARRG